MPAHVPHFLPDTPKVELEVVGDRSSEPQGFLTLKRFDLVLRADDGKPSTPFRYDLVERHAIDAAVIVTHHIRKEDGVRCVYLRSAVRPPVALRHDDWNKNKHILHEGGKSGGSDRLNPALWELPAGLIEPGEDPQAAAARELEEELGFALAPDVLQPLGSWSFPAPAFIAEIHFFFHAQVDPSTRKAPGGDGSPLEEVARIESIPLVDAIAACRDGTIRDAKTELALRRLVEVLG